MKKILCCLIVSLMLVGLSLPACATSFEEKLTEELFYYFDGDKCDLSYLPDNVPLIFLNDYVVDDDVVFVSAVPAWRSGDYMSVVERYGEWCFYTGACTYPSNVGMYVRINGEFYTLKSAWEEGLVTDLSPTEGFSKYTKVYRVGDADLDLQVSIMDATLIQLRNAQLVDSSAIRIFDVADVDGDGKLSVLDATAIQLKLAGLEK